MKGLVVDLFAGGGGASLGIEMALGRSPDVAINHDATAIAIHAANHQSTRHLTSSVWQADPRDVVGREPVALLWASPDCKHFSKAKGRAPVARDIRDLAWVTVLWAQRARPAVILLENVEEFRTWGPVLLDGRPCPDRAGATFLKWVRELRRLGYRVEHRELRACDYGVPTIRKRLFVVARCDGLPIVWPKPTHGPGLEPYRTAAECIDWSIPCPSIFGRKRPLAENTLKRIAAGIRRYVLEAPEPFIVPVTRSGTRRGHPVGEPVRTITTAKGGEHALVAPFLVPRYGERPGQEPRTMPLDRPGPTVVPTANGGSLVAAFLAQHNGGERPGRPARAADEPVSTVTATGSQQALCTAHLMNFKGSDRSDAPADAPCWTITAGGTHLAEVRAFLVKYYGTAFGQPLTDPLHTVTTKDRYGLVTIAGQDWQIVDIGMRMLTPRELARAQGFPDSYVLDVGPDGRPVTKAGQVRMIGNSVCPPLAAALVRANLGLAAEASEEVA